MFKRFFNKNRPDFWQEYIRFFKINPKTDLATARFVIFDTETTGLNISNDRILSIGAISIIDNLMDVSDSIELYLNQDVFNVETVEIHGILKEGNRIKIAEEEAIVLFLDYIKDSILVAHHADFDVGMINSGLARMGLPKLRNKVLDTGVLFKKTNRCENKEIQYSLDFLCDHFNVKKHDRHTASGDAYLTGLIFMKILTNLKKARNITLIDLFFNSNRSGLL